jgi:DnaJ-domain-containing protein 1
VLRLLLLLAMIAAIVWLVRRLGQARGNGTANQDRPMSRAEACAVLGIPEDADRNQIIEAHRRLMQRLHPDRGGSDALASRVNAARRVLLDER